MAFLDSLDIANRALQYLGVRQITSITENSKANQEITSVYDKLRRAELRRNVWRFATRRVVLRPVTTTTMIIQPRTWNAAATYMPGSIIDDANGQFWISMVTENVGNVPGASAAWEEYFGPMTADLYDTKTAYYPGELVYTSVGDPGGFVVYMSLTSNNANVPTTVVAWNNATSYSLDDRVTYLGTQYRSVIPYNLNITPANGPALFDTTVNYAISNQVTGSDGYIYTSLNNSNLGHDPVLDGGVHWTNTHVPSAWASVPSMLPANQFWLPLVCNMVPLRIFSPIGFGPGINSGPRSLFHLPAGYLREAPQDPKAGSTNWLGGPHALAYTDWEYEGDYIVSQSATLLLYRFVADITDVTKMDDMFCEGFAATLALAVCESLTQSTAKLQNVGAAYKTFMGEARTVNGIETGATEPPEDDYVTARL